MLSRPGVLPEVCGVGPGRIIGSLPLPATLVGFWLFLGVRGSTLRVMGDCRLGS